MNNKNSIIKLIPSCLIAGILFLSSCNNIKQQKLDSLYSNGLEQIKLQNHIEAINLLEDYRKIIDNRSINDSVLAVFSNLAWLYFQIDSIEQCIQYQKLISKIHDENNELHEARNSRLMLANYLVEDFQAEACQAELDLIAPVMDEEQQIRLAIIKDKLHYVRRGYYIDKFLDEIDQTPSIVENPQLSTEYDIQKIRHQILDWDFIAAEDGIMILTRRAEDFGSPVLRVKIELLSVYYFNEQNQYARSINMLDQLMQSFDSLNYQRHFFELKYTLARCLLFHKQYARSKVLMHDFSEYAHRKSKEYYSDRSEYYKSYSDYSTGNYTLAKIKVDSILTNTASHNHALNDDAQMLRGLLIRKTFDRTDAIKYYDSLMNAASSGTDNFYMRCLLRKVETMIDEHLSQEAYELINDQLELYGDTFPTMVTYYLLANKARCQAHLKNTEKSMHYYNLAYNKARSINFLHGLHMMSCNLAIAYLSTDQTEAFEHHMANALKHLERDEKFHLIDQLYWNIGLQYYRKDDLDAANECWLKAISYKELARENALYDDFKRSLISKAIGLYYLIQQNYLEQKNHYGCYWIAERTRAMLLEEKLQTREMDFQITGESELNQTIPDSTMVLMYSNHYAINTVMTIVSDDTITTRRSKNNILYQELFRIEHFQEYLKTKTDSAKFEKIKSKLANEVNLRGYLAEHFLASAVNFYRSQLQNSFPDENCLKTITEMSQSFYKNYIKPIEQHLNNNSDLVIIPDGILSYLPFETLISSDNKYLIEDHPVSYAPSLTVWQFLQKSNMQDGRNEMLAIGIEDYNAVNEESQSGPDGTFDSLEGAAEEIEAIERIYPKSDVYLNHKNSYELIMDLSDKGTLQKYRNIHFSVHGVFTPQHPEQTCLLLPNNDGQYNKLNIQKISQLSLNADFVNLSACETGLGDYYDGEGVYGLAYAFTIAGARGTCVTLWCINDKSSARFMERFYQLRVEEQLNVDEALALVKREYIQGDHGLLKQSPFYWAPYIYYGQ
jgi:CHAT domain-containing protein